MPYILDENSDYAVDKDGNRMEFKVEYINDPGKLVTVNNKTELLIREDGHLDTEDRHLVIKDGVDANHAVSTRQFDETIASLQRQIRLLQNQVSNRHLEHSGT